MSSERDLEEQINELVYYMQTLERRIEQLENDQYGGMND